MCVMHGLTMELSAMIARVLAARRHRSMVSVAIIEVMVYMTIKVLGPMKPRSCTHKYATRKPFRTVVTVWSAVVRRHFVISVGAHRRRPNAHRNLSWSHVAASKKQANSQSSQSRIFQHIHLSPH
jgi:hypothetical protein